MAGLMITAPASGSGKTMITCGMLEVLKRKKKNPWAFKCGPDYIDGLFHRRIQQVDGGNFDSFFEQPEHMREKYRRVSREHFVLAEGAMGYFDGLGGISAVASAYETACILGLPSVLVVDSRGASLSLLAQIKGFLDCDAGKWLGKEAEREDGKGTDRKAGAERNHIAAVIFNRMSPGMYPRMKKLLEEELEIPAAGYVPQLDFLQVGSRHLGLILPGEIEDLRIQIGRLADCLEESLDWNLLEKIAFRSSQERPDETAAGGFQERSGETTAEGSQRQPEERKAFRLGVAADEAFCFYYRDNLELLENLGAEIVFFSPVHDKRLPEGLDGLLFGGGYPELYGKELEKNEAMKEDVRNAAEAGMPMLGECGGYLYLLEKLQGEDGAFYEMAGLFSGYGYRKGKNGRFGYVTLRPEKDTPYLGKQEEIRGHEFHYWDCECDPSEFCMKADKPAVGRSWLCMRRRDRVLAGFPHLYYPSCPSFARHFAEECRRYGKEKKL